MNGGANVILFTVQLNPAVAIELGDVIYEISFTMFLHQTATITVLQSSFSSNVF